MTRDELIEAWCQALESGEYVQGTRYLKYRSSTGTEHCCLGVACELVKKGNLLELGEQPTGFGAVWFDETCEVLPVRMGGALGLRTLRGDFELNGKHKCLTQINDKGTPFKEIAALIRSRPKGLFVEES